MVKQDQLVILRSGGPAMTVLSDEPGGLIRCGWFNVAWEFRQDMFQVEELLEVQNAR